MEQLSNYVTQKSLLEVSELQQQIACDIQSSQHTQVNTLKMILEDKYLGRCRICIT